MFLLRQQHPAFDLLFAAVHCYVNFFPKILQRTVLVNLGLFKEIQQLVVERNKNHLNKAELNKLSIAFASKETSSHSLHAQPRAYIIILIIMTFCPLM